LGPLLFLFLFGDVDALGHQFGHVPGVIPGALATLGDDALGLVVLLVGGVMGVLLADVVLDHGRTHRVLQQHLPIVVSVRPVLLQQVVRHQMVYLIERLPIAQQGRQVGDFLLEFSDASRFLFELVLKYLVLGF
jgi:fructose-specific phosphotransferase system IIC component